MYKFGLSCLKFKRRGGVESYVLSLVNGFNQQNIDFNIYCDIVICGGNHKGFIKATNKKKKFYDNLKIAQEQKTYNSSKAIIAHSELMKNELIELYQVPEDKIKVIYPPIDSEAFYIRDDNERLKLREKYNFSKEKIYFLFPSTGHKRKGFELLAEYFNKSNLPIELVVVGSEIDKKYEKYKNIRELGFSNTMSELYSCVDFTIMASIYEPFGLVAVESILCGTPVVMSDNMACTEVFNHQSGITFDRSRQDSLDIAIKQAVNRVKVGQGRIDNPLNALEYDPSLSKHIEDIITVVDQIKSVR
ncbi:glycosyltransferase family 4 protein [Gallibacterium melopsittaci]|uniref:Glycosyltransferase family 4 protein n=1 Tax=Gallibacterium melopsittaci TaxID=516063 RepID=A0ABV6HXF0_9PAST